MGSRLLFFPALLLPAFAALSLSLFPPPLSAQSKTDDAGERERMHGTSDWVSIQAHLPDPATATPGKLETAADVLRARRFPADALDFYRFALDRGGDVPRLMNRMGITELELRHPELARSFFQRAVKLQPKNAEIWNNLGAADFVGGNTRESIRNYGKAVKLDKANAVFHSNLGTAYFELKDYESARKQFDAAFRLDPKFFQRPDGGGIEARIFSSFDRGKFCFELARAAALRQDDASVLVWLTKAGDAGFDIQPAMSSDRAFEGYNKDPRIKIIVQNARAIRTGRTLAEAPTLPSATTMGGATGASPDRP